MKDRKNHVYGIIGLVALFLMGGIFGYIINGSDRINKSVMTEEQCQEISNRIGNALKSYSYDSMEKLNKIYSENCVDREFQKPQPKPEVKEEKLPDTTCEAVEKLLKNELSDEESMDWQEHKHNADVYLRLAQRGCDKNKRMYQGKASREIEIARALDEFGEMMDVKVADKQTCQEIEDLLLKKLNRFDNMSNSEDRVERAQIYANLSERGCPENVVKYRDLARQELEIARALTDDRVEYTNEQQEATKIVETYKRLQMQQEAAKMIEKAKKIANPAIDFIIQLEKIIEE